MGHHDDRCWPFRSRHVDGRRGVLVVCVLSRNTWGSVPANWSCLPDEVRKGTPSASEPSARQPPRRMGRCAAFAKQGHHGGMMRCNGGVKEGEIGAGGCYSSSMRTHASIDDGGRRHPTVATGPHSRLLSVQQSTHILGNRLVSLKLETVIINYVY